MKLRVAIYFPIAEKIEIKHYINKKNNMKTNEAIKAIKDYLRYSNVSESQFSDIVFQDEEATLNGKALFFFIYNDGGMDLMNLDHEDICKLNMDILAELFDSLYFQVYCEWCSGNHEDCNHENVIYKN